MKASLQKSDVEEDFLCLTDNGDEDYSYDNDKQNNPLALAFHKLKSC